MLSETDIDKTFKAAALNGDISILDEILQINTKIQPHCVFCSTYYSAIRNAIEYANKKVLTYLLEKAICFEYRYCDCLKHALFFGNIEIIRIIIESTRNFKYEHLHGSDSDQDPECQYNGQKKVWESGGSLIDIDIFHNKIFVKSCIQGDTNIIQLFRIVWTDSLNYTEAIEIAKSYKRDNIVELLESPAKLEVDYNSESKVNHEYTIYTWNSDDKNYKLLEKYIYNSDDAEIINYIKNTPGVVSAFDYTIYKLAIRNKKILTADFIRNYILKQYKTI